MANANPDDFEKLTYRDLAARLGVSSDAARMKAKRRTKAGAWRIIPGNHPSDPVLVEVPLADLNEYPERDTGEHTGRSGGERKGERTPRTIGGEQANAVLELALTNLADAQARVRELTDQLVEAKDAHRRDAMELAAADMREMGTKAELERALFDIAELRNQLAHAQRPWWRKIVGQHNSD